MEVKIEGLFAGTPKEFKKPGLMSAFVKDPYKTLKVSIDELENNAVSNHKYHGGPDRVVHHYPAENFPTWKQQYPKYAEQFVPGSFGENISSHGVTEKDVCIGDIFSVGRVKLQITEGRKPCGLIDINHDIKGLFREVEKQIRMGWFYKVLEGGEISEGDMMKLEDRPHDFANIYDCSKDFFSKSPTPLLEKLLKIEPTSTRWKASIEKILKT